MPSVSTLLSLGGNRGDVAAVLARAAGRLGSFLFDLRSSSLYRSQPVGFAEQPDFLNLVVAGSTNLSPHELLQKVQAVEMELGRTRPFPNAPRTLDIDILAYGELATESPALTLPHPRLDQRAFVLAPLAEVAPEWRHPVSGLTAAETLERRGPFERVERVGRFELKTEAGINDLRVSVQARTGAYQVRVARGLRKHLGALVREVTEAERVALISDQTVDRLHGDEAEGVLREAGIEVVRLTFPAGEQSKDRRAWAILSDRMVEHGLGRDAAVVALGGGVTGDLAGFTAATFMRGVPVVQVPTSLLAMIDAAIGGKTGLDTKHGKNLVGAFHPPRAVLVDPGYLDTLPDQELQGGLAEAVKHAAALDEGYFDWLGESAGLVVARDGEALLRLVTRSVEIKAGVVSRDEREAGARAVLNFGHTVGHALELASGYLIGHGRAVAAGMVAEAVMGERTGATEAGTADRLRRLLDRFGLPSGVPGDYDPRELVSLARQDKKTRRGRPEYALISRVGQPIPGWTSPVPDQVAADAIRACRLSL
ncbi:MAG: 3-dehydroquinate synthase [Longimicrobiaceae bacterium]